MLIKPWLLFLSTLHNVLDSASLAGYQWLLTSPLEIVFLCWIGCHPFTTAPCSASDTPVVTAGNCRLSRNHCNAVMLFSSLVRHHSLRQNVILMNIVMCLFALQHPATNCRSAQLQAESRQGLKMAAEAQTSASVETYVSVFVFCTFLKYLPLILCICLQDTLSITQEFLIFSFSDSIRTHFCTGT